MAFILKVEELYSYILENNFEGIGELKEYVIEVATNILQKDSLHEVRDNKTKIVSMMQDKFWEGLTFSKVDLLVKELAPLVKYYEPEKGRKLQIDAPDEIRGVRDFEFEIHDGAEIKPGSDVTDFLESNPIAKKISLGEGVTSEELMKLEKQLTEIRSDITIENIQKKSGVDYLEFLRKLLGVSFEISPAKVMRNQFRKEVFGDGYRTTQQQNVLEIAESVFIQKKISCNRRFWTNANIPGKTFRGIQTRRIAGHRGKM
ncbi:hypothetical protein [Methanosarcina horonobensis]|uniref:hypothetical protein n=1 Tax=Methanosarcina horonobensis TaxID=418008 RepID=UPI0022B8C20C|nr:hypothetical protein [Methanosarcina horonobensis]